MPKHYHSTRSKLGTTMSRSGSKIFGRVVGAQRDWKGDQTVKIIITNTRRVSGTAAKNFEIF